MLPLNHRLIGSIFSSQALPEDFLTKGAITSNVKQAASWLANYTHALSQRLVAHSPLNNDTLLPCKQFPQGGFVFNNRVYNGASDEPILAFNQLTIAKLVDVFEQLPPYYNLQDVVAQPINYYRVQADLEQITNSFQHVAETYEASEETELAKLLNWQASQRLISHISTDNRVAPQSFLSGIRFGLPSYLTRGASCFLALRSAKYDQLSLVEDAIKNGYRNIICEFDRDTSLISKLVEQHNQQVFKTLQERNVQPSLQNIEEGNDLVLVWFVNDSLRALHALAKYHRVLLNPLVVAVTGSSGKTTVKDLTKRLLQEQCGDLLSREERINLAVDYLRLTYLQQDYIQKLSKEQKDDPRLQELINSERAHDENPDYWELSFHLDPSEHNDVYTAAYQLWNKLKDENAKFESHVDPQAQELFNQRETGFIVFIERTRAAKALPTNIPIRNATVVATSGNYNNQIGVPLSLLQINEHTHVAVIEHGANHKYEIGFTTASSIPNVAYINNIQQAHTSGFGGVEGVAEAKAEIVLNTIPHNYVKAIANLDLSNPQYAKNTHKFANLLELYTDITLETLPERHAGYLRRRLRAQLRTLNTPERQHWGEVNAVNIYNGDKTSSFANTSLFIDYNLTKKVFTRDTTLPTRVLDNLFRRAFKNNYAAIDAGLPLTQKIPLALDALKHSGFAKVSSDPLLPIGTTNLGFNNVDEKVNYFFPGNIVIQTGIESEVRTDGFLGDQPIIASTELSSVGFMASTPLPQDLHDINSENFQPKLEFSLLVGKDFLVDKRVIGRAQAHAWQQDPHYEQYMRNPPAVDPVNRSTFEEKAQRNRNEFIENHLEQILNTTKRLFTSSSHKAYLQAEEAYRQSQVAREKAASIQNRALEEDSFSGPLAGGLITQTSRAYSANREAKALEANFVKAKRELQAIERAQARNLRYGTYSVRSSLLGAHQANNLSGVIAICSALGLEVASTLQALALLPYQQVPGRNYIVRHDNITIIDDTYNANPGSLTSALEQLTTAFPANSVKTAIIGPLAEVENNDLVDIYSKILYKYAIKDRNFRLVSHAYWGVEGYTPILAKAPTVAANYNLANSQVAQYAYLQANLQAHADAQAKLHKLERRVHEHSYTDNHANLIIAQTITGKDLEENNATTLPEPQATGKHDHIPEVAEFFKQPLAPAFHFSGHLQVFAPYLMGKSKIPGLTTNQLTKVHQELQEQLEFAQGQTSKAPDLALGQALVLTPPSLNHQAEEELGHSAQGINDSLLLLNEQNLRAAAELQVGHSFVKTYKALVKHSQNQKSNTLQQVALLDHATKLVGSYLHLNPAPEFNPAIGYYPVAVVDASTYSKETFFTQAKEAIERVLLAPKSEQHVILFKASRSAQLDKLVTWLEKRLTLVK